VTLPTHRLGRSGLQDLNEIANAIERTGAGVGPARHATVGPAKQEVAS